MALELLQDPLARNALPEHVEGILDDGLAYRVTCCEFNRKGTLLAVGGHDGRVVLWDFDTRMPARYLVGHVRPVTSISWSKSGRKLLTSSLDWTINIWDLQTSKICYTKSMDSMVLHAELHPNNENLFVASMWMDEPYLIDAETGTQEILSLDHSCSYV